MFLNVTIPVYNEEAQIGPSVARLLAVLGSLAGHRVEVVIAENGSTDRTAERGDALSRHDPRVRLVRLPQKGRGGALARAWRESQADVLTYMDVDLSTDLDAFPALIGPVIDGSFDLVTGSRLLRESRTTRGLFREVLSRGYSALARTTLKVPCRDLQCGFKAISRRAAHSLLPEVQDSAWFFDTELIYHAAKAGWRVKEIPVIWREDPDSRVRIVRTVIDALKGLARLRRRFGPLDGKLTVSGRRQGSPSGSKDPLKEPWTQTTE